MIRVFTIKKKTFADDENKDNQSELRQKTLDNLKQQLKTAEEDLARVQTRQQRQEETLRKRNDREIESYKNRVQGIKRSIDSLYK